MVSINFTNEFTRVSCANKTPTFPKGSHFQCYWITFQICHGFLQRQMFIFKFDFFFRIDCTKEKK